MEPQALEGGTSLEMDLRPALTEEEPSTSALWDWSDLLDFTTDDHFNIPLVSDLVQSNPEPEPPQKKSAAGKPGRVRKRDPRMTCSNFLAGRIPCACPEIDEKLEEEEANMPGKKRPRTGRVGSGRTKCQIPGCEADISELKGYHIRHRVCLRCATASSVLLDGTKKRYCQQCGKFHVLSDFDEGKRSCRWKLERHNEIRRKKSADSKTPPDNEPSGALQSEDLVYDGEGGKDGLCVSSQLTDQEAFFESEDGPVSTLHSAPNSQNVNSDSGLSFAPSGEIRMDGGKDDANIVRSPSNCDNKSAYSSLCPTGRISFKLYDWNPAEFPRRLRHQIFEWLASMPVELEGYIRPGCTILTVFIAMPKSMWAKLYEDPVMYVHDFVVTPGRMLSGRGSLFVYLNNIVFHVKDGASIAKVKKKVQAPRLHFVHPKCFEAGKPMEFVACGSNLMQPRFRFLISFAGKYLPYECRIATPRGQSEGDPLTFDHQLYKIYVPQTEQNLFGPAFVEVENESGLSNFIPVLIGDKETCHEMKMLLHRFEAPLIPEVSQFLASGSPSDLCEFSAQRQTILVEFLSDIAWLLKVPTLESFQQTMSSSQVQRFNSLFSFLLYHESTTILGKLLQNLNILMDNMGLSRAVTFDTDMGLLLKNMDRASDLVHKKLPKNGRLMPQSWNILPKRSSRSQSCSDGNLLVSISNQDLETRQNGEVGLTVVSDATDRSETVPLVSKEVVMNVTAVKGLPKKSCGHNFSGTALSSRPTVFIIAITAVCFGICVVLVHPKKVGEFAVSIRRSLFGKF